jgi:pimeloyl-ACP methyl ester carboxylesterase
MLLFQLPWLPEALARRGNFALAERMLGEVANPDAFSAEDVVLYKRAIAQPGGLTAALNYYRAMRDKPSRRMLFSPPSIDVPTMLIWGDRDRYLRTQLAEASRRWVPQLRVEHVDASHWVQNDAPEAVNALLLNFLRHLD